MEDVSMPPQVPTLQFLLRHSGLIPIIAALLPLVAGMAAFSVGRSWLWGVIVVGSDLTAQDNSTFFGFKKHHSH